MKRKKISETIDNINSKYIDEATGYTGVAKSTPKKVWYKWVAVAACFALVLCVGIGGLSHFYKNNDGGMYGVVIEDREPIIVTIKEWRDEGFICTVTDADIHEFISEGYDVYIEFSENTKVDGMDFVFDSENPNAQECGLAIGTQVELYFDAVNYKDGQSMAYSLGATEIIPK